jgi:hypothetical protein
METLVSEYKIDLTGDYLFPFAVYRKAKPTFWNRSGWKFVSEHISLALAKDRVQEIRGLPLYA